MIVLPETKRKRICRVKNGMGWKFIGFFLFLGIRHLFSGANCGFFGGCKWHFPFSPLGKMNAVRVKTT